MTMRQMVIPATLARAPALAPAGECCLLTGESMGTTWQVRVHAPATQTALLRDMIEATLAVVIRQMSHWHADSDLSRFNRAAAGSDVVLPELLFDLLVRARQVAAATQGAYDPTAGALVRRWGFGPDRTRFNPEFAAPDAAVVAALRARSGWRRLLLDPGTRCATQPGGMELDLSAIAKGFAVDLVSLRLQSAGYCSHLVEIGGELRGAGLRADAQPWWVALEPPADDARLDETVIALCDRAVATSGDYRRCFDHAGQRFAHTLDPRTGRPVQNDVASVSVISDSCWQADAVSTALLVMGIRDGLAHADQHGIAARFVQRDGVRWREHCSHAWRDMLS